jgi:hypothetical protein
VFTVTVKRRRTAELTLDNIVKNISKRRRCCCSCHEWRLAMNIELNGTRQEFVAALRTLI